MTAFNKIEDLMMKPFNKTEANHKKFRVCNDQDYLRIGVDNYLDDVKKKLINFQNIV